MLNLSADPLESDYLADGIAQAVAARLTQAGFRVIPWDTARRYRDAEQGADAIARELTVDAVLVGTFQLSEDEILLNLSLVDAETGFQSWADIIIEPYENVFEMQLTIARSVASSLKQTLTGEEEKALASAESRSTEAYDLYLQGSYLMMEDSEEATNIALEYFQRARDLDPDFVDAQVGVGAVHETRFSNSWGGLEDLDRARSSYEAALRLNPASIRARQGLIHVDFERGSSESCLSRAREATRFGAASDVDVLLARAEAYQLCGLPDLSLPLLDRVLEVDPRNQAALWRRVISLTWSGDHSRAVEVGREYLESFGDDPEIHLWAGVSQHLTGNAERAWNHYRKAIEWEGGDPRAVYLAGFLFDGDQQPERARELWKRGVELALSGLEENPERIRLRLWLACFYGLLHRNEFRIEEERALGESDLNVYELRYLAIVHAWRGDEARAVAILRDAIRRGRLDSTWRVSFDAASVSWENEAFAPFVREYEELEDRLRRTY
jgi:TolB-like protein